MQWRLRQCSGPLPRPSCKSCQKRAKAVSSRGRIAILILSRKSKRIKLRESDLFPLPSPECRTVHFRARRYGRYYRSSLMSRVFLFFIDISLSLSPSFLPLFFFSNLHPGEKISDTVRDRASMTINWPSKCTVKNINDDTYRDVLAINYCDDAPGWPLIIYKTMRTRRWWTWKTAPIVKL